jgi:glycosyltransferase involved in cell wall biosynthesis
VGEALVRDGLDQSRLTIIPSAFDPRFRQWAPVDLRTHLRLTQRGQLAVTLGSLTPEKDHSTLILAAARLVRDLPDLHWIVVGEGAMQSRIQQQIADCGLAGRVHLMGPMADPHQALGQADIFVLSSISEGLGTSVLAAMAEGVPVVATRVGGVPDLLDSGAGLLVEPRNPEQLADAVRRVLGDVALRQRLTARAREELGNFRADAMAERVVSVYRSCAHTLDGA